MARWTVSPPGSGTSTTTGLLTCSYPPTSPVSDTWPPLTSGSPSTSRWRGCIAGDGQGGFEDVALEQNLRRPNAPMGSNFGDLDNDGYLDFYLGTGYPDYQDVMPNVMFRNRSGESFADVTTAGGFAHLQKGHAIAFADLDHDGDQDVFEQMGGALPGDGFHDVLYENPGFGNQWIGVKLIGRQSNRSAQGARLRFDIDEGDRRRTVYKPREQRGNVWSQSTRADGRPGKSEKDRASRSLVADLRAHPDVPRSAFGSTHRDRRGRDAFHCTSLVPCFIVIANAIISGRIEIYLD